MGKAPWNCTPGWDVPRDYFTPDPPDENEESFDEMVEDQMDMQDALEADGEKLRQMTGEDHGPFALCSNGSFCSDQWCLRLGCALERDARS